MDAATTVVDAGTRSRGRTPVDVVQLPFVQRYWAFLSYSHRDSEAADWLHRSIERFRLPDSLVGKGTALGPVPKRLVPVFRDRQELAAGDLDGALIDALASSRALVVLCSPSAAASRWTNEEIRLFKRLRPDGRVLAVILSGEPWAADMPGREAEECFPAALKQKYDRAGAPTGERAEPIAADLRGTGDGRQLGLRKIVAGIAGLGLDDLVQRDTQRRQRRMLAITGASLLGMVVASGLALAAVQARDEARSQRRQAEGLIGFMLGDLKDKLEPLGRLDALDAVGTRTLRYFEAQDKGALSDAALAQRSRALTMMGEIASLRGDLDGALRRYREAWASTAEALRRSPEDPQRMFDHAQNVFYIGTIDWQRGRMDSAEAAFREYKSLANRMLAAGPGNTKWQLEGIYADTNLGMVLLAKGQSPGAAEIFDRSLGPVEQLQASDPTNRDYRAQLINTLAYLSDARARSGMIEEAIAGRERELTLLAEWATKEPNDTGWPRLALAAHRALARAFAWRGDLERALMEATAADQAATHLRTTEPSNTEWLDLGASAAFDHSDALRMAGQKNAAATAVRAGCDGTDRLIRIDPTMPAWRFSLREACLFHRSRMLLADRADNEAQAPSAEALALAAADPREDLAARSALAEAYRLQGDVRARLGDQAAARLAWTKAAEIFADAEPSPERMASRALVARQLGDRATFLALQTTLAKMGFRRPDYIEAIKKEMPR